MATVERLTGLDRWERETFSRAPEREAPFSTISGEPVKPLNTEADLPARRGRRGRSDPVPGRVPYTRGVYGSMYRGRLWTMRQFAGFGTAQETNGRFRYLLDHGQTGLSTAFDMPSLMGLDSDHPRSLGEVGREGVAVDSLDDMESLFALARGLDVDDFAPRLSFFFDAQIDFFEEIAKYRAARRVWARELRDTFGAKKPESWRMRFHTQTAGVSLTAQQPLNNIVRTAIEALAGVLGGTQSLHTNSFDEARSYLVEGLTDRMEEQCYEYFEKVDALGGMVEAVKRGFPQREIADAAFRYQHELESGERRMAGVNAYTEGDDLATPILRIDPALEGEQIRRVESVRARRDGDAVTRVLDQLVEAAREPAENLMPLLLEAARADATEGEIVKALQTLFGSYTEAPVF